MKKFNTSTYILIAVLVFIFIPLCIAFLVSFNFINTDTSNEWIGFWGGYLGGILGGVITLYVLFKTLGDNKRMQNREEKMIFCDKLTEDVADFHKNLSLLLVEATMFRAELRSGHSNRIEELLRSTYTVERNLFILNVKLSSKKDNRQYQQIIEVMGMVSNVSIIIRELTTYLRGGKFGDIGAEQFNDILNRIEEEEGNLFQGTIKFLVANEQ